RFSPRALARRARRAGRDAATLGLALPDALRRLLDAVETDGLDLHLRADELDPLVARVERMGNRLVAGMVAAALITGIGQLTSSSAAGRTARRLTDVGVGALGGLGAYLAWTWRRGR
ncbi:MAG: ABC1 kinase family protein, partial [Amnibacterium sp.]